MAKTAGCIPVSMRILGDDARVLHREAEKLQAILKTSPYAINVRDDWGNDAIRTRLEIDHDRAGLAGVSSSDIAVSMYSGVVGATVLALFPLALDGGPLWQALCYAQIGGLTVATAITVFLVFYAVFVLDLHIVRWPTLG